MAKMWTITSETEAKKWAVSEIEAKLLASETAGAKIEIVEIDEIDMRNAAAKWLNLGERNRFNALKREKAKTAEERSENAKKAWETRKKQK